MFLAGLITFYFNRLAYYLKNAYEHVCFIVFCLILVTHFFVYCLFSSELFCHKNKTFFGQGDILKFPQLAETMETIAREGADAFYTGKIAKDLIQDVQARSKYCLYTNCSRCNHNRCCVSEIQSWAGVLVYSLLLFFTDGILSLEDLSTFKVRVRDARTVQIGDYKMYFPPPPAGGEILSFILKLMHGGSSSRRQKIHHGFNANRFEAAVTYKYSASLCFPQSLGSLQPPTMETRKP